MDTKTLRQLSDRELIDSTTRAASVERHTTVELLALLGELDRRRLYLGEGYSSLFTYCTRVLHLSEHAAYHRIEAARAARQFPVLLELLAAGALTLTTLALLRPHLTTENIDTVLGAACHKTRREVEEQIACLGPRPDTKPLIRRVPPAAQADPSSSRHQERPAQDEPPRLPDRPPLPTTATVEDASVLSLDRDLALAHKSSRGTLAPLAPGRYLIKVTVSAETHRKLRRAQDLLRHSIPAGDPAAILDRALTLLVEHLERTKVARTSRPASRPAIVATSASANGSRHVPAALKRAVWARDQGRCTFHGSKGRCAETGHLEFHHIVPFAVGGKTDIENLTLRCRAHNRFESDEHFGRTSNF